MKCIVDKCPFPATHTVSNVDGVGQGADTINVVCPACTDHANALAAIAAKGHMVIQRIGKGRRSGDTA